jgi:hypothetical protein
MTYTTLPQHVNEFLSLKVLGGPLAGFIYYHYKFFPLQQILFCN